MLVKQFQAQQKSKVATTAIATKNTHLILCTSSKQFRTPFWPPLPSFPIPAQKIQLLLIATS